MTKAITPKHVRYIKLGREGRWEQECLKKGIVRYGYGTGTEERYTLCIKKRWDDLTASFLAAGKDQGTATRFTNETRLFFEDSGATLWITFVGECFCWGFLTSDQAKRHNDGDGVFRKVKNGWQSNDVKGELLT